MKERKKHFRYFTELTDTGDDGKVWKKSKNWKPADMLF